MKKKRFFPSALSFCLLGAVVVPSVICASSDASDSANTSSIAIKNAGKTTTGDHVVTPNATTPRIENRPISGTTYLADFDIKANYGYVRLYIKNTGKKPISFTINQGSPGGRQKASGTVEGGETYSEIVNESSGPWAIGTFYVNLTSGSAPMEGQLGVRISTDTNF